MKNDLRTSRQPATIDAYLERLPDEQRAALQRLRKQIKAAVPDVEENFGYGMPAFWLLGHPLLYFGAARKHCALYGGGISGAFAERLKEFHQSKGTLRFTPDKPIPATLLKALLKARAAEHRERWSEKAPKRSSGRRGSKPPGRSKR